MTTNQIAPELRLLVHVADEGGSSLGRYLTVTASVVYESREEGSVGQIRNPDSSVYAHDRACEWADFAIRGQISEYKGVVDAQDFYGYEPSFHQPYDVNLARAEMQVKTLRRVQAKMTKLDERFGRPTDFAGYLGRLADAIGATSIGIPRREDAQTYDEAEIRWTDVDGLRFHLSRKVKEWMDTHHYTREGV